MNFQGKKKKKAFDYNVVFHLMKTRSDVYAFGLPSKQIKNAQWKNAFPVRGKTRGKNSKEKSQPTGLVLIGIGKGSP